jgi:hypothetical protein
MSVRRWCQNFLVKEKNKYKELASFYGSAGKAASKFLHQHPSLSLVDFLH